MNEEHQASSEGGAPEYMVSYADMLTIMLSFFIVLYATTGTTSDGREKGEKTGKGAAAGKPTTGPQQGSGPRDGSGAKQGADPHLNPGIAGARKGGLTEDAQGRSLNKVFESLYYRFGPDWTVSNCWSGGPPQLHTLAPGTASSGGRDSVRGSRGYAGDDAFRARSIKPGDTRLVARVYFDESSVDVDPSQKPKLRRAVEELAGKVQKIEVRGHTSRRPLPAGSPYHDHWELAFARCRSVKDFLVAGNIDPARIRLSVAADNEPMDVEDDDAAPANRQSRVEIRWLEEYLQSPSGIR
jgi:chemotaxis protein MotB